MEPTFIVSIVKKITGTYIITAYGAQGGGLSGGSDSGGKGAKISSKNFFKQKITIT